MLAIDDRIYSRKADAITADLGEELAVLDLETASYLGLNPTAAFVWRRLQEPQNLHQLCDAAILEFEVDESRCGPEIDAFLAQLLAAKLVAVSHAD